MGPVDDVNFRWRVHQENIAILGMQGSGKTSLARRILRTVPDVPRVIWSPQLPAPNYGQFGEPTADVREIGRDPRRAWLWVGEFGPREFDAICRELMAHGTNMLMVVDDAHERVSKHRVPEHFARLVNSGRNRGITSIWITPAPNVVSNQLLQSAHHVFAFAFGTENNIDWIRRNWFGDDAYALLPVQLRRRRPGVGADLERLPPHSYLYKHHASVETRLHLGGGNGPHP